MTHYHTEGYESPLVPDQFQQQTPVLTRKTTTERTTNKRPRSYISPLNHQQADLYRNTDVVQQLMTHPTTNSKIYFPPIIIKFVGDQQSSIKEITDDLISKWKIQHGIDLVITARFGHLHSLLIFADDSSTFESLLDPTRWPRTLKEVEIEVKAPRQLPPAYSLVIQQFHRNWNEDEWLIELQQRYVSLYKITRMRVKDGSLLNAVRADFRSIDEVKTLLKTGKINVGSMIHPIKPYYLPIRINKCLKCLRHDHTTKSCTRPRLCPRCAEEHSLENGCPNQERCVNCGGEHMSGHSCCAVVQEKRRALLDQSKRQKAELLVMAERQQHHTDFQEGEFPVIRNDNSMHSSSRLPSLPTDASQRSYAQVIRNQREHVPQKNIEYTLSSFLNKMERRLDEFSSRLSSQLCDIEKKINVSTDRQNELENVINEVILPSIQELGHILSQSPKNRSSQESFKKFNLKIKELVSNRRIHVNHFDHQSTANHFDQPTTNVPHH